jgi:rhamnogalacturonan acetylesterase
MSRLKICILCILSIVLCSFILVRPKARPTVFLIGDSTVKNGSRGQGDGGLWGWGAYIWNFVDTNKIAVQNRALGGTSSNSFISQGLWERVLADVKPGDIVLIQFGHNDNGANSIRNNSDSTKEVLDRRSNKKVVIHSYGWNLRKYISETKAKGATPVVLSLIPRNIWRNGKIVRASDSFGLWAKQAAEQSGGIFVDLNRVICDHYDQVGEEVVSTKYFTSKDHTHTIEGGAKVNAKCVISGLKQLKKNPLKRFLLKGEPTALNAMIGNGMVIK